MAGFTPPTAVVTAACFRDGRLRDLKAEHNPRHLGLGLALPQSLAWRNEIIIVAFGVVAFSVVVEGPTMPLLLRLLGFLPKRP